MSMSATEKRVYQFIAGHGKNKDVAITAIYHAVYGELPDEDRVRTAQQVIGAFISRINEKLEGAQIKPGALKRTYRLSPNKAK